MMQDKSILTGSTVQSYATIATAGKDTMRAKTQGESLVKMSDGQKWLKQNRALHVPEVEHTLFCVKSV